MRPHSSWRGSAREESIMKKLLVLGTIIAIIGVAAVAFSKMGASKENEFDF